MGGQAAGCIPIARGGSSQHRSKSCQSKISPHGSAQELNAYINSVGTVLWSLAVEGFGGRVKRVEIPCGINFGVHLRLAGDRLVAWRTAGQVRLNTVSWILAAGSDPQGQASVVIEETQLNGRVLAARNHHDTFPNGLIPLSQSVRIIAGNICENLGKREPQPV